MRIRRWRAVGGRSPGLGRLVGRRLGRGRGDVRLLSVSGVSSENISSFGPCDELASLILHRQREILQVVAIHVARLTRQREVGRQAIGRLLHIASRIPRARIRCVSAVVLSRKQRRCSSRRRRRQQTRRAQQLLEHHHAFDSCRLVLE